MIKVIIAINDHGQSFCFKQIQLVVYKLDNLQTRTFKGNAFLYFQLEDFKAFQLFKSQ